MNTFFSNVVSKLDIKGYQTIYTDMGQNKIHNVINKFKDHPSIFKIKQRIQVKNKFTFSNCNPDIMKTINNLNILILSTIFLLNLLSQVIYYNDAIINCKFPDHLKKADILLLHIRKKKPPTRVTIDL